MGKCYIIETRKPTESYYEVTLKADTNDADYKYEIERFNQEQFDRLAPLLKIMVERYSESFKLRTFAERYGNRLCNIGFNVPSDDWCDYAHSFESLEIAFYDTDGSVSDVNLIYDTEFEEEDYNQDDED